MWDRCSRCFEVSARHWSILLVAHMDLECIGQRMPKAPPQLALLRLQHLDTHSLMLQAMVQAMLSARQMSLWQNESQTFSSSVLFG